MGIKNAMAHIVSQVQLITPGTDDGMSYVCDADATGKKSPCWVRVGMPVDGPVRWMSNSTAGTSA